MYIINLISITNHLQELIYNEYIMKTSKKSKRKSHKKSITSRSLNYIIAIPSYKRWEEITKKTLPTLKRGKVNKNKIYVFVANKTEEKSYREKLDPNTYHKIVVGKKGLVQQRRFISQSKNTYGNFGLVDRVTNPGILAARTKWHRSR